MEHLELLGMALGLATLAGVNLYLTVFLTGLAIRFDWISLAEQYQQLEILSHPAILTISGVLFFLEFFADKIPWVDSLWDTLHTVIRPVGGTLLAIQALGTTNEVFEVVVAILAFGFALTAHTVKAGSRLLVNGSPEPVSNMMVSSVEDVAVVGGLWLIFANPVVSLVVLILLLALSYVYLPRLYRGSRGKLWLIWRKLQALPMVEGKGVELSKHVPSGVEHSLHAEGISNEPIDFAVQVLTGRCPGVPTFCFGYLLRTENNPQELVFVRKKRFRSAVIRIPLGEKKVQLNQGFLASHLKIYQPGEKREYEFVFDCRNRAIADQVFAKLEKVSALPVEVTPPENTTPEGMETSGSF